MDLLGKQYTVTATAASLDDILGNPDEESFQQIDFYNDADSTGNVYIGGTNVTAVPANAYVAIVPGKAWSIGPLGKGSVRSKAIYVIGTADDTLHIAAVPF